MMKLKNKVSNYEVIDDFIPEHTNDYIFKVLSGKSFPWFISDKIIHGFDAHWNSQYYHMLYENRKHYKSDFYSLVDTIIGKLDPAVILRVKVNSTAYQQNVIEFPFHTDTDFKSKTCVYYVNDNNGYTYFEDGSKVYSKARRLLRFDSNLKHSGTTHSDTRYRFVININYIPKEMTTYDKEVQS